MKTSLLLVTTLGLALSATACKKKESEEEKMAKALEGAMKDLGKSLGSATKGAADKATEKPAPKGPELAELSLDVWGIKLQAPKGATFGETEAIAKDDDMPGSTELDTSSSCGVKIDIYNHPKASLEEQYKNAKSDDLPDLKFMVDEKTDGGFKIHYTGNAPIGAMYGVNTGAVVGDRLLLCSSGMNRMTQEEAACVYSVCSTITGK
jgi:hypothetical protein